MFTRGNRAPSGLRRFVVTVTQGWGENGHYYVSSHGKMTEVSRGAYVYSLIHSVSVVMTHAAFFITAGCLYCTGHLRLKNPTRWPPYRP